MAADTYLETDDDAADADMGHVRLSRKLAQTMDEPPAPRLTFGHERALSTPQSEASIAVHRALLRAEIRKRANQK